MARNERTFRTDAIILRRQDFKETDRLLTLFTPEYGKFTVIAKGVRKPTGRMTGHVELYTRCSLMLSRGRDLDIVTQAELQEPFLQLQNSLERGAYASYAVELVDRFTEPEERHDALYDLLCDGLRNISADDSDLRIIARFYELSLLSLVGFQPELFDCVVGHEPLEPQDQYFSAFDGGAICPEHAENNPHAQPMSLPALKVLRYMTTQDWPMIRELILSDPLHLELERILQSYIVYLLERRLRSVDFIRRLRYGAHE